MGQAGVVERDEGVAQDHGVEGRVIKARFSRFPGEFGGPPSVHW
jgi:hypothetical protein